MCLCGTNVCRHIYLSISIYHKNHIKDSFCFIAHSFASSKLSSFSSSFSFILFIISIVSFTMLFKCLIGVLYSAIDFSIILSISSQFTSLEFFSFSSSCLALSSLVVSSFSSALESRIGVPKSLATAEVSR